MNIWHCRASLSECTCRTWTRCMHRTIIRMWLNLRPQNITKSTHVYNTGTVRSGLAKACCTQAGPAHAGDDMDRSNTLFWHVLLVAPIAVARRDLSPLTGTVSQATKTNGIVRLPCGYLYHFRHWIGKSTSNLHLRSCCHHRGGTHFTVDCYSRALFCITQNTQTKSWKWFTESGPSKQASKQAYTRMGAMKSC